MADEKEEQQTDDEDVAEDLDADDDAENVKGGMSNPDRGGHLA